MTWLVIWLDELSFVLISALLMSALGLEYDKTNPRNKQRNKCQHCLQWRRRWSWIVPWCRSTSTSSASSTSYVTTRPRWGRNWWGPGRPLSRGPGEAQRRCNSETRSTAWRSRSPRWGSQCTVCCLSGVNCFLWLTFVFFWNSSLSSSLPFFFSVLLFAY